MPIKFLVLGGVLFLGGGVLFFYGRGLAFSDL